MPIITEEYSVDETDDKTNILLAGNQLPIAQVELL